MKRVTLLLFAMSVSWAAESGYMDHNALSRHLDGLAAAHPGLIGLSELGVSAGGRVIYAVTVAEGAATRGAEGAATRGTGDRPALLVVGGILGGDLASTRICLDLIEKLVQRSAEIDSVTSLLARSVFYVVPGLNPDAAELLFHHPVQSSEVNSRPVDDDGDGLIDEDGGEDLNDDGLITCMRVPDPQGSWIADAGDPELMRKADFSRGERGRYRLFVEGVDDDGDGLFNEDPAGGIDLNRNFSARHPLFEAASGPHPFSESETRALADFCFSHTNIAAIFTFSHNSNLFTPWEGVEGERIEPRMPIEKVHPDDLPYYRSISDRFRRITRWETGPESLPGGGGLSEWAYYHFGRWSLSAPAWWPPSGAAEQSNGIEEDPIAEQRVLLRWLKKSSADAGYLRWSQIEHPDFPGIPVEVGGLRPGVPFNPAPDSLALYSERHTDFLIDLAARLPRLEIEAAGVEALAERLYRVTLHLRNSGHLPVNTAVGANLAWAPGLRVSISVGENQSLASGRKVQLLDRFEERAKVSWVIRAPRRSAVSVKAGSPLCGFLVRELELK